MAKVLISLAVMAAAVFVWAAPSGSDLAALQKRAKEAQAQLKKYQQQEAQLQRQLKNLTQKEKQTVTQTKRLSGDIELTKEQETRASEHKDMMEGSAGFWQSVVARQAQDYAVQNLTSASFYGGGDLLSRQIAGAQLGAHAEFLALITGEAAQTAKKLQSYREQSRALAAKIAALEAEQKKISGDYQKTQTDLAAAHKRAAEAASQLKELNASAAQMQEVLKRAQAAAAAARAAAQKQGAAPSRQAAVKKGALMWPVNGKIISKFGKEYNQELKTWIFRDGVKISTPLGTPVEAVKDGTVIYAGNFRSYGNVVIVDHGGGFFTIYGFLGSINVAVGSPLYAGQVLGASGRDSQGSAMGSGAAALYFEVRQGTRAEDPERYLQ